jgi:hypothetical protein
MSQIMEHADSCLILISARDEQGQSISIYRHGGNFYACRGVVAEWLETQQSRVSKHIFKDED